jgi:ribosome recycling factor
VLTDVKELMKEKEMSQDDEHKAQEDIQKLTDRFIGEIDQQLAAKEKEILQV